MASDARGFHPTPAGEIAEKVARVSALARREHLAGILISTQHNFAWLSGGRSNRVDAASETGVAALLVAADGRLWAVANNIESGRLASETLAGLPFDIVDFPWELGRADPATPFKTAVHMLDGGEIGSDAPAAGARAVESLLTRERARLTAGELPRYRTLGTDAARVVGALAHRVEPERREHDIAAELAGALLAEGMRPLVVLVGADGRISQYRHPVPTALAWRERLLIVVCAERHGLVVALSRIVSARRDDDLIVRTNACANVFGRIATATATGARGADIFAAAADGYRGVGYPGEERLHHQGGAIGYKTREWIAHPESTDSVCAPQAFAWNPSITGTKVEETLLLHEDGRIEALTHDPVWPSLSLDVRGTEIRAPGVWVRDA